MIIKKVLNTSVVLAEENGREKVVLGKGIGFGKKVGMEIDPTTIEKSYEAINSPEAKQMMGLIHEIPEEYFEIANKIIEKAKTILSKDLNQMILFNLTDHIFFAIERYREGMIFSNKISYEIKTYYPNEYSIGLYAIKLINETYNIDLPEVESANIAFHFINAQQESNQSDVGEITKLLNSLETLVRYSSKLDIDSNSTNYQRFVTHIRFFVERFFNNQMLNDQNQELYEQICKTMPVAMAEAEKIHSFIIQKYDKVITIDELTYLAIHFQRLLK